MIKIGEVSLAEEGRVGVFVGQYKNGRPTVMLLCERGTDPPRAGGDDDQELEPYETLAVHVADVELQPGEFVLHPDVGSYVQFVALASLLMDDTGRRVDYGYGRGQPVWRLRRWPVGAAAVVHP